MRAITALLVITVVTSTAGAASRRQCREACGAAVRACIVASGKGRPTCKRRVIRRCRHQGLDACRVVAPGGSCWDSSAPACNGSCPYPEFACVPNPLGTCNCEAPACGLGTAGTCGGVCPDGLAACVLQGDACVCL